MVLLLKNIVLRCGPGCFRGALAIAFVKIPYVPAPHFSWRASYSICQNPIRPCTTLVAWVGTPCSIQRGTLDSGHGRSIQRGVLDRWMHSRTVSVRKRMRKKIQLNRPALFNAQNFETEILESLDFSMYPTFDEQAFDSKSGRRIVHQRSEYIEKSRL